MENNIKQNIMENSKDEYSDNSNKNVHWKPVSNIKGLDPYEDAPESVKQYHENYVKFWNLRTKDR